MPLLLLPPLPPEVRFEHAWLTDTRPCPVPSCKRLLLLLLLPLLLLC